MITFDQYTADTAGAFLTQQLTKYDWTENDPLYVTTWDRDVRRRSDVTITDQYAAYVLSNYASPGNLSPGGKSWLGAKSTAIAGPSVDRAPIVNPVHSWGQLPSWSMMDLWRAQFLGQPLDKAKLDVTRVKFDMDTDEQVYVGDTEVGATGMVNDARVTVANAAYAINNTNSADQILSVIQGALTAQQLSTGYARVASKVLMPWSSLNTLASRLVSTAGSISISTFLGQNSVSLLANGRPLELVGVKWLETAGVGGVKRAVFYTDDKKFVQFPRVELMNLPVQNRGFDQVLPVMGALGVVEIRYPETFYYLDGI